ncbi:hypothetical protein HMPREF9057_00067 [Actinomyces sp. oral taxon 171 str. F0337]|nr:hypothetical protein HMPREF9057_00067 [Actinomyces sp. oral taxon 171 str. F0337]
MRRSAARWWSSHRRATPFTFDGSQLVYERLVAPRKQLIDDVLLHRGRTSPANH